jgi:putative membrane protein insertion efficiency factor
MGKFGSKIGLFFLSLIIIMTKTVLFIPRGSCRFYPSCSEYASEAIQKMPLKKAIGVIIKRILKCTPISRGGFDPVPTKQGRE